MSLSGFQAGLLGETVQWALQCGNIPLITLLSLKMKTIISQINALGDLHQTLANDVNAEKIISIIESNFTNIDLQAENQYQNIPMSKGLYAFYAKFPFDNHRELMKFGNEWGVLQDSSAPGNCPRFHKTNAKSSANKTLLNNNEYLPFYLGKSEALHTRVIEHIDKQLEKTVYALKLRARSNILKGIMFKVGFVKFDIQDNSYFCIELLETKVRGLIRPIVGKQ